MSHDGRLTVVRPSFDCRSKLLKYITVLVILLTIGVGNAWGAAVPSQAPANGKSYVIAYYYDGNYYALPHIGSSGGLYCGELCTLNGSNQVTAIEDEDSPEDCLWLLTSTGTANEFYISYDDSGTEVFLYKNGTTGSSNYSISATSSYKSNSKWLFTSGTANSVTAYSVKTTKSGATKNTVLQGDTDDDCTFFNVDGTSNVYAITLLKVAETGPTITPSVSELDWGTVAKGASLTTKTFTITGTNLTSAALVYSASGGYSVSPSGKAGAAGTLSSQTLTVTPPSTATPGTYNSTVSITGGGLASAVTVNVKLKVENTDTFIDEVQNTSGYTSASPHIEQGSYGTTPTITDKSVATSGTCEQLHYHFVGWITAAKYEAGTSIAIGDLQTPTSATGATYYAVWAKQGAGGGAVTWTQVTSVSVGDEVVIAQIDDGTKEMNGFNTTTTTANNFGTGAAFTTNPAGTMVWTVEAGNSTGQFSFKNGDYYLNLASDNNYLNGSATKNANSSWTVSTSSSRAVVTNASQTSRKVMWNKANTRFASYAKNHGNNSGQYYYHIVFYKRSGGVSYEDYIAKCCTPLGSINGSIFLTKGKRTDSPKQNQTQDNSYVWQKIG